MTLMIVASNTFRGLLRDRALLGLTAFAAVVIGVSGAFGMISAGEGVRLIIDISLPAILLSGVLISILVGTNLIHSEIERGTIYALISRPVGRWEFVVGKYAGIMALLGVSVAAMSLFLLGYLSLFGGGATIPLLQAIVMIFFEVMVVAAIALLLSTLASPMFGAIVTFTLFLAGHGTDQLKLLSDEVGNKFLSLLFRVAYYVVPSLENFNIRAEAAYCMAVPWGKVGIAGLWAVAYSTVAVLLAVAAFEKRSL